MFKSEINHLCARLEEVGRASGHLQFNRCATPEQIAVYENQIGVALPAEYREFILQIGDGLSFRKSRPLSMAATFPENGDKYSPKLPVFTTYLVAFPFEEYHYNDEGIFLLHDLKSLSWHEKMEKTIGLRFASLGSTVGAVLVLRGVERGNVWFHCIGGGLSEPCGLPFFEAFERMLPSGR